jgi:hypothetical protein
MNQGWKDAETFECWLPARAVLVKGGTKGADKTGKRWISGIASTDAKDLQGEIVDQQGINFDYFLKHGWFNNDHKPGFENKVGQPTECKVTKQGLFVKGYLFEKHQVADSIWDLMSSLDNTQADRKVGFSIQGKVTRRDGNKIKECWISEIAITACPVNHTTWCDIAKSLSSQPWDLNKDNDKNETKNKALSAGSVVVPESLEGKATDTTTSKSLSYDEAVELVMKSKGIPEDAAKSVVNVIFSVYS